MSFILALGRQRQMDLCEFKAGLVYRVSSRPARAIRRPCLKNKIPLELCVETPTIILVLRRQRQEGGRQG